MAPEEYLELVAEAHEALRELLVRTEPGTGPVLHTAYRVLGQMLERPDADKPIETEQERLRRENAENDLRRRQVWKHVPKEERFHWVLNALGGDSLSIGEVWQRMTEQHPEAMFWDNAVRGIMTEMLHRGELKRREDPTTSTDRQKRWLYYRAGMSPEVAALARVFDDEAVA